MDWPKLPADVRRLQEAWGLPAVPLMERRLLFDAASGTVVLTFAERSLLPAELTSHEVPKLTS